jgi:hypothetical protein
MRPEICILRSPSGQEKVKSGYFMEKEDLVRLVRDHVSDCCDGYVDNDDIWIEAWLNQRSVGLPVRGGAYYVEGSIEETSGLGKGIKLDPEAGVPVAPAYEKDPQDYAMSVKVILGIYVLIVLGFSVLAFLEQVYGFKI